MTPNVQAQEETEDVEMMETPVFVCNEECLMYVDLNEAFNVIPFEVPDGCIGCSALNH